MFGIGSGFCCQRVVICPKRAEATAGARNAHEAPFGQTMAKRQAKLEGDGFWSSWLSADQVPLTIPSAASIAKLS
jgi:hypothetical protein